MTRVEVREISRDQNRQGLVHHGKGDGYYSRCNREPLEGFNIGVMWSNLFLKEDFGCREVRGGVVNYRRPRVKSGRPDRKLL